MTQPAYISEEKLFTLILRIFQRTTEDTRKTDIGWLAILQFEGGTRQTNKTQSELQLPREWVDDMRQPPVNTNTSSHGSGVRS